MYPVHRNFGLLLSCILDLIGARKSKKRTSASRMQIEVDSNRDTIDDNTPEEDRITTRATCHARDVMRHVVMSSGLNSK